MPIIFLTVKLPDGGLVHLDVDNKTRVEEFRTIIAPKVGIKRHKQRLVFAGKLLQDGRTLEAYGVERNSTIHLLHGPSGEVDDPGIIDISTIPNQLGALQRHVLANPDILQQMLESPAMQNLLNDHELLRSLLKMDPRLNKLLEGCPELKQMLQDAEFMNQASEALRNPVHVRDILRSTDRAVTALEALPQGGFDVFRQMCEDIRRPMEDPEYQNSKKLAEASKKPAKKEQGAEEGAEEGEAPPEAEENQDPHAAEGKELPPWSGQFDLNAMASMMQDQNMQQLLAQLVQTMPGPTIKPHPDDPFVDPSFLGQMFHSQTISSMTTMQDCIAKLSLAADPEGGEKKKKAGGKTGKAEKPQHGKQDTDELAQDSPAVLSGLHPKCPAANPKESFALFLQAEQESPEVRFKGQLQTMANMGFTDKEACIVALHNCDGNMKKAVDLLMDQQAQQKPT